MRRSMFGNERSPAGSRRQQQNNNNNNAEQARPLAASAADSNSRSSRRRQMAFMRYGTSSDKASAAGSNNPNTKNRMREHARQITMQLSQDVGSSPVSLQSAASSLSQQQRRQPVKTAFADFGSAFPADDDDEDEEEDLFASMPSRRESISRNQRQQQQRSSGGGGGSSTSSGFATFDAVPPPPPPASFFDTDPFGSESSPAPAVAAPPVRNSRSSSRDRYERSPVQQQQQQRQYPVTAAVPAVGFETDWPTAAGPPPAPPQSRYSAPPQSSSSMSTMPSNSSMQASFAPSTSPEERNSNNGSSHAAATMTSPQTAAMGAAARRRMRNQMRKGPTGSTSSGTAAAAGVSSNGSVHSQELQQQTPPQSPHSVKRYVSSDTGVGSNHHHHHHHHANSSAGTGGRIANHVQNYSLTRKAAVVSTRSVGSRSSVGSATRSTGSSNSESEQQNLFDANVAAGFSFDAFGLDASQFDRDVSEAMQEIVGGGAADLSHFVDQDPADDFAAGRWDSPAGSRSSTPAPPEEEGFVDGFRVTKKLSAQHSKQSPTASTEKTSWTSESDKSIPHSSRNLFKEQAGFHASNKPRKVIRPHEKAEDVGGGVGRARQRMSPQRLSPQRSQASLVSSRVVPKMPDLDQERQLRKQEVEFVDVESDFSNSNAGRSDFFASETGARSDVAFASDVGVSSDIGSGADIGNVPMEVNSKKKKSKNHSDASAEYSSRVGEEKKEDVEIKPKKTVGSLRSQWEQQELLVSEKEAQRREERQQKPASLARDHIENLQSQLGHELLSPEKLERRQVQLQEVHSVAEPQRQRVDECADQRTSFASLRERLKSPTNDYSTKSEGGATVRHSHVSAVLGRLRSASPDLESPRDTQSDAGGSPAFMAVKLRKTGFDSPKLEPPLARADANDSLYQQRESPTQAYHTREEPRPERSQEWQEQPQAPQPKMSYRERRELELHQQREEEERRIAEQQAEESSQRDVASVIKRRIAANKRSAVSEPLASPRREEPTSPAFRERLRPTESARESPRRREPPVDYDVGPQMVSPRRTERSSAQSSYQQIQTDLVVEEETAHNQSAYGTEASGPSTAVSHLHMLQQLEQRQPHTEHASRPPPSPVRDGSRMGGLTINAAASADSDDHASKTPKGSTPKATMMMLNAFLHGRESISSADGAPNPGQSQTGDAEQDHADAVDESTYSTSAPSSAPGVPGVKDDPQFERYFRMLKIGMPADVVKHAMIRDGVDPSVLDGDPNKPAGVPLKDDPTYQKYFKMMGFGLPMEAVKHAMERDGLDSSVMDRDHTLPVTSQQASQGDAEPTEKDSHRRARLHWKPLRKVTSNSLWAKIDQEFDNIEIDEEEFQELFQLEKGATAAPTAATSAQSKRGSSVRVIDPKRANNGGIILARLKMSHDDMADAVDRINENALTAEQIENIIEYLPTKEERKSLEAYMLEGGQDAAEKFEGLCECEKFMVSMMTVKHAKRKVRALLFKLQFENCLEDIHNDTVTVESACDELSHSVRLRQLFGFVLTFGNRLNMAGKGGNGKRKAGAFTLDSLLKLNQAKAFDKKTTFLNYLVLIVQRNNELLLNFKDDVPSVFKADKIFWDQCLADLEEVENQLENVRKIALYQARQAQIYRARRKKQRDDDGNESLSDGEGSLSLEEEVEALRATPVGLFTLSAIKYVSSLRDKVESTKAKFGRLLEYFGEEDKNKSPHELFTTIVTFSRDFDKAKETVIANQKKELREERKRQAKAAQSPNGKPTAHSPAPSQNPLKASNMQPSMSSVLAEMKHRSPAPDHRLTASTLSPVREADGYESGKSPSIRPASDAPTGSYTRSPAPAESPMPSRDAQQTDYSNASDQSPRSRARYDTEREPASPNRSFPASTSNHALSSTSTPSRSAVKRPGREASPSEPVPLRQSPSPGKPATSSTALAMRQKARLRMQRHLRSPASPADVGSPAEIEAPRRDVSPARSESVGLYSSQRQAPVSPARSDSVGLHAYSRSTTDDDEGATQPMLSPRSSIRHKRRIEMRKNMRNNSASAASSSGGYEV